MNDLHSFIPKTTPHATRAGGGNEHGAVINKEGKLYTFGYGSMGQLGLGQHDVADDDGLVMLTRPRQVELPSPAKSVSCGDYHTIVLTEMGQLYAFGSGGNGELGTGKDHNEGLPVLVRLPVPVLMVACGSQHTVAILENGEVYSWGRCASGQLGNGKLGNQLAPGLVVLPRPAVQVACGGNTTAIITDDGSLYMCGQNYRGQLGTGDVADRLSPTRVDVPYSVVSVATDGNYTMAVTKSGSLYEIGPARYPDNLLEGAETVIRVACGDHYAMVLTSDLALYAYGDNESGQLGTGDLDARDVMTKIAIPEPFQDIICGLSQSFGIGVSGDIYVWGANGDGQLGLPVGDDEGEGGNELVMTPTLLVL